MLKQRLQKTVLLFFALVKVTESTTYDKSSRWLHNIPSNIPNTTTLINLRYNSISTLDGFQGMELPFVQKLFFGHNRFTKESFNADFLSNMTALRILHLDSNELGGVPRFKPIEVRLRELNLGNA